MGIDLLATRGERLDGELFKTFTEPVKTRGSPGVFEGENEVDASVARWLLGTQGGGKEERGAENN
jgi:hypothetical protein